MVVYFLGKTVRLTAVFKDYAGTATDVDSGTAKCTIYNPLKVAMITSQAGTKRAGTTSTYDYQYDLPASGATNAVAGTWVQSWEATTTVGTDEIDVQESSKFKVYEPDKPPS